MRIALLFILVFRFDGSGYGLFQILWIFYPRPLSSNAQYLTPDTHHWCSASYTRYTLLMLRILHQIYIFINFRLDFSQLSPHTSNCISEPKPSRCTSVKLGCHWPARLWFLSSSHYPSYSMKKLTSHHKGRRPIASNRLLNFTINCGAQRW